MKANVQTVYFRVITHLNTLTMTRRILVCISGVLVLALLSYVLLFQPMRAKKIQLSTEKKNLMMTITQLEKQMKWLLFATEKQRKVKQQHQDLQQREDVLKNHLSGIVSTLMAPTDLSIFLRALAQTQPQLILEDMVSLPPKKIVAAQKARAKQPVYQYPVQLKLRGNFQQLVVYLQQIEQLPWRIVWDELTYDVDAYPMAEMTVQLHVISNKGFS